MNYVPSTYQSIIGNKTDNFNKYIIKFYKFIKNILCFHIFS